MVDTQICDSVKNAIDEFLNSTGEVADRDILLNDDDFNQLMEAPDISFRLSDNYLSFDDGIAVGLSIGFRMGMVNTATQFLQSVPKPDINETGVLPIDISDDTIEINSDEISYS
jgi:hypothetical protein